MIFKRHVDEPVGPLPGDRFTGDAVVFRDGFHYPATFDPDGNDTGPDLDHPLVYRSDSFVYATPEDLSHFHVYGQREIELQPGSED